MAALQMSERVSFHVLRGHFLHAPIFFAGFIRGDYAAPPRIPEFSISYFAIDSTSRITAYRAEVPSLLIEASRHFSALPP